MASNPITAAGAGVASKKRSCITGAGASGVSKKRRCSAGVLSLDQRIARLAGLVAPPSPPTISDLVLQSSANNSADGHDDRKILPPVPSSFKKPPRVPKPLPRKSLGRVHQGLKAATGDNWLTTLSVVSLSMMSSSKKQQTMARLEDHLRIVRSQLSNICGTRTLTSVSTESDQLAVSSTEEEEQKRSEELRRRAELQERCRHILNKLRGHNKMTEIQQSEKAKEESLKAAEAKIGLQLQRVAYSLSLDKMEQEVLETIEQEGSLVPFRFPEDFNFDEYGGFVDRNCTQVEECGDASLSNISCRPVSHCNPSTNQRRLTLFNGPLLDMSLSEKHQAILRLREELGKVQSQLQLASYLKKQRPVASNEVSTEERRWQDTIEESCSEIETEECRQEEAKAKKEEEALLEAKAKIILQIERVASSLALDKMAEEADTRLRWEGPLQVPDYFKSCAGFFAFTSCPKLEE